MKIFNPKLVLSSQVIATYGDVTEKDLQWHLQLLTAMAAAKNKPLVVTKNTDVSADLDESAKNINQIFDELKNKL